MCLETMKKPYDTQRSRQYIQNKSFKECVPTKLKYKVKVPGKSIPHRDRNATLSPNSQIFPASGKNCQ